MATTYCFPIGDEMLMSRNQDMMAGKGKSAPGAVPHE